MNKKGGKTATILVAVFFFWILALSGINKKVRPLQNSQNNEK